MSQIPRIIWMVWLQGAEQAPPLVKECIDSWKHLNPEWKLRVLDKDQLQRYISTSKLTLRSTLPPQAATDIIRTTLLKEYGGVWVDASVFCAKPLDEWIDTAAPDGFFAFSKPRADKLISSWFLASSKDNLITHAWYNAIIAYWSKGLVMPKKPLFIYHKLVFYLFLRNGIYWPIKKSMHLAKQIGLFPYFWLHYLFNELYEKNTWFREIWNRVPCIYSAQPLSLTRYGLHKNVSQELRRQIEEQIVPVYKLDWRTKLPEDEDSSTLGTLLRHTKATYHY